MNLDDELRNALRREDPPGGFAARVMARIEGASAGPWWRRWPRVSGWSGVRWAAAAALLFVLVLGGMRYTRRRERIAGERAKQQLVLALRITGVKLHLAQTKVYRLESGGRNHAPDRGEL